MRKKIDQVLCGISVLSGDVTLCMMALSLSLIFGVEMKPILAFPWVVFLIAQFFVGRLMVGRGGSVNLFLIVQIAIVSAAEVFLTLYAMRLNLDSGVMFLLNCAVAGVGIHAGVIATKSPTDPVLSYYSDLLIVALVLYLWAYGAKGSSLSAGLICFTAVILGGVLFSLVRIRTESNRAHTLRGKGTGASVLPALVILACLILTGAILGAASGQIHGVLDFLLAAVRFLWNILCVIFNFLGYLIGTVILFFIRLFPSFSGNGYASSMNSLAEQTPAEIVSGSGRILLPAWLLLVTVLLIAAILFLFLLTRMRHRRFSEQSPVTQNFEVSRTGHLREAIAAFFRRMKEKIQLRRLFRKYRKTPQGLFLFLQRRCRAKKIIREKEESPGGFIRRICQPDLPDANREVLLEFALLLDKTYYSGEISCLQAETYRVYRQAIKTFLKTRRKEN